MKVFKWVSFFSIDCCIIFCLSYQEAKPENPKPNVVIIIADDLGYGDVKLFNPETSLTTPNLNRLGNNSITFTDAHSSSAVCTPSRYSLLTGRYPWRSHKKKGVFDGYVKALIEKDRQTLASIFKNAWYNTSIIGKWHLGVDWQTKEANQEPGFGTIDYSKPLLHSPNDVGFDYSYIFSASLDFSPAVYIENGMTVGEVDYIAPFVDFPAYSRRAETTSDLSYEAVLDHLLDKILTYINEHKNSEDPFFLYFPLTAPHKPLLPAERFREGSGLGWYGDFIQQVDWTVGEVLKSLEGDGLAENTIVIFSSDNGSYMHLYENGEEDHTVANENHGYNPENHKPNLSWRGTKGDIFEAGHRVPLMIHWPGQLKARKSHETVCLTDISSTLVEMLGLSADVSQMEDGYSLVPIFSNEEINRAPVIHQSGDGALAIRKGNYKLILCDGSGGREEPKGNAFSKPYQLYDLAIDPYETTNLINSHAEIAEGLEKEFYEIVDGDLTEEDISILKM